MVTRNMFLLLAGLAVQASGVEVTAEWKIVAEKSDCAAMNTLMGNMAKELQTDLEEATGLKPEIVRTDDPQIGPKAFYIGATAAKRAGFDLSGMAFWDNTYAEKGGSVYFFGNDRPGRSNLAWHGTKHVLGPSARATLRFLYDQVGVRFLMPGRVGTEVPKIGRLAVKDGLRSDEKPKLIYGNGFAGNGHDVHSLANGFWPTGIFYSYGGHTYGPAAPFEKYGKTNPEIFAMDKNGKRWTKPGGCMPYCISNPLFRKLLVEELYRRFDAGATVCQLGQNDGWGFCYCKECHDLYGTGDDWGEKIWLFHRDVAEQVLKERPGKIVHILSYALTSKPPKSFKAFPSNVMIEVCDVSEENLARWKDYTVPNGFTYYVYNWGGYPLQGFTAKHSFAYLADQARRLWNAGNRGVFSCGYGELFGTEGPCYYLYHRVCNDPETDVEATVGDYCRAAYGPAMEPMLKFFTVQDKALARAEQAGRLGINDLIETSVPTDALRPAMVLARIDTPETVAALDAALEAARETPGLTERQVKRIGLVALDYAYARATGLMCYWRVAFEKRRDAASFRNMVSFLRAREEHLERIRPDGKYYQIPGWPEIQVLRHPKWEYLRLNGRLGAPLKDPLLWPIDTYEKYGIVPGERLSPEARATELKEKGLCPIKGFGPRDGLAKGAAFTPYPDGTGFVMESGPNTNIFAVACRVGKAEGLEPGKSYKVTYLVRWHDLRPLKWWHGYYLVASYGRGRDDYIRAPKENPHTELKSDWIKESALFRVTGDEGFASRFSFTIWNAPGATVEVRDVTIEEVPELPPPSGK